MSLRRLRENFVPKLDGVCACDCDCRLDIVNEQKDWRNMDVMVVFMATSGRGGRKEMICSKVSHCSDCVLLFCSAASRFCVSVTSSVML